jgi:hypothetical protein
MNLGKKTSESMIVEVYRSEVTDMLHTAFARKFEI